jgi:hypothetical protein
VCGTARSLSRAGERAERCRRWGCGGSQCCCDGRCPRTGTRRSGRRGRRIRRSRRN